MNSYLLKSTFGALCISAATAALATPISVADLNTTGSATKSGNVVTLTPDVKQKAGWAFDSNNYLGVSTFAAEFDVYLGTRNGGADGIAFGLFEALPASSGAKGGALGYQSGMGGYAVEFDTWKNGSEPSGDHVSILDGSARKPLTTTELSYDLEDGLWRSVFVSLDLGQLSVWLDQDPLVDSALATYDLGVTSLDGYFGFMAATGGARNLQQVRNVAITVDPNATIAAVPLPAAAWLFGTALLGLAGFRAKRNS